MHCTAAGVTTPRWSGPRYGRSRRGTAGAACAGLRPVPEAQVTLGAMSSFYAVLQAEALLAVASENQQQQLRRQKQSESFFKIGTKPQIDVLIAQTAVAQARLQVLQAQGNVRVTRTQLLQSLGLPEREWDAWHKRPLEPALPPPHPLEAVLSNADADTVVMVPDETVDRTLQARPDFQSLLARVRQAEAQLRAARADYLPSLTVGASASMNSGTIGGVSGLDVTTQTQPGLLVSGTLGLNWPLLTGLRKSCSSHPASPAPARWLHPSQPPALPPAPQPAVRRPARSRRPAD